MIQIKGFSNYVISRCGTIKNRKTNKVLTKHINENGYIYVSLWKDGKGYTKSLHRLLAEHFIPNPENKPHINHINANRADYSLSNLEWVSQSENIKHAYKLGTMSQKKVLSDKDLSICLFKFLNGTTLTELVQEYPIGLSRLSINLRNYAVKNGSERAYTQELIKQKRLRNIDTNEKKKTPIVQLSKSGERIKIHESQNAAARYLGRKSGGPICNVLKGRAKTAYGFKWKYL